MDRWKADFFQAKKCIFGKDMKGALNLLHQSIKDCPVENGAELADVFFYLGIAFKRLGFIKPAVRSWDASMCADKGGRAASLLGSLFPAERVSTDKSYFFLIQLSYYLAGKKSGKIDSAAEKDMILDLISMYWEEILDSNILKGKCQSEKILIFKDLKIAFPYVETHLEFMRSEPENTSHIVPFKLKYKSE